MHVKDPGFVKAMFTIAMQGQEPKDLLQYNPQKDLVAQALGRPGPHDPFDPVNSTIAGALLLKENGITHRPKYATGAYFAGPGGAYNPRTGGKYTKKNEDVFVWACQQVRQYYRTNGWKVRN